MTYKIIIRERQNPKEEFFFNNFDDVVNFLAAKGTVFPLDWEYNENKELIFAAWENVLHNATAIMETFN